MWGERKGNMATAAEFTAHCIIIEIRRYYITPNPLRFSAPSPCHGRCIFEKSLMCENRVRACVQAGYYPCHEGAANTGWCLGGRGLILIIAPALSVLNSAAMLSPHPPENNPSILHTKNRWWNPRAHSYTHKHTRIAVLLPLHPLLDDTSRQITRLLRFLQLNLFFTVFNNK